MKRLLLLHLFIVSSLFVQAQTTWYTLASGDWDDADIWTLDPAGAIPVGAQVPSDGDNVFILSGKTVVVPDGVGDYLSPLRNVTLNLNSITIRGQLDLRTSNGHTFDYLKGNGRLLLSADNYPTIVTDDSDFNTQGEGEGTVVFYGSSFDVSSAYTFCNLEVNMNTGETITLANDLVLNGDLNVSGGTLQINDDVSTTALGLTINGDVVVESHGNIAVGEGYAFHWLNVYGDFINAGTVTLTNSAQYVEATNGAVKLKFQGESDNVLECYNSSVFYRIFVNKGTDKTYSVALSSDNNSYFSLYGPVSGTTNDGDDGAAGYQRAPIVIENGTLELGSNIVIERIAENISGSTPNEFTIPESGRLIVNGADVTTAGTLASSNQYSGINVQGQFKIVSGTFTTPKNSSGLTYIENTGEPGNVIVEGGILNLTNLKRRDSNGLLNYYQSGGTVNFQETGYFHSIYGGTGTNAVFSLPDEDQVFSMSGGTMVFGIANNDHVTGIFIKSGSGNYSVTGGTVEIYEPLSYNFNIYTTAPFYNLTISNNSSSSKQVQFTGIYGGVYNASNSLEYYTIKNDLTISSGALFSDLAHTKYVGGDLIIEGTYTQTGPLIFNGSSNGHVVNNSGSTFSFDDFIICKNVNSTAGQFYTVSLTGSDNISIDGNLDIIRGALDVIDFWPTVADSILVTDGNITSSGSGGMELNGTSQQVLQGTQGKEQDFGSIKLNNTGSSPQFLLLSDVNAKSVEFMINQVFDIDMYNFDIDSVDYKSWGWSTSSSKYFLSDGNSSDGGLTLQVNLNSSYSDDLVQLFPVQTGGGYSPVGVFGTGDFSSVNDSGKITVIPVNSYHPTVKTQGDVVQYYWIISTEDFSTADEDNLRYRMFSPVSIASNMNSSMVFTNNIWEEPSGASESNETINYPFSSYIDGEYTQGKNSAFNSPRILYSRGDGSFNNKNTWSETGHSGTATNSAPKAYDICIVGGAGGSNHTVTIDANGADASQIEILGNSDTGIGGTPPTLYVNSGTSGHDVNRIKGNGRLVYENNFNYGPNNLINGDHSEFCNSLEAIIEFAGSGSYWMPATSSIPYYPNLVISGGGTKHTPYNGSVYIGGDLTVEDADFTITNIYAGTLSIGDSLKINTGTLTLSGTASHNTYINGSIVFSGAGTLKGGNVENKLYLEGNIVLYNGATINCNSSNKANFVFEGDSSSVISIDAGTATIDFYRVYVNKSTGQSVQFVVPFNLNSATDDATKSLVLQSGECVLNNSSINIDLTTGSSDFSIPSGTKLYVTQGTVNASGNSGLKLDGSLIIDGGTANIDGTLAAGGTSNSSYIEFTSSGDAYLEVSNSATLNVGDQIRRLTTTDDGILTFVQNGGAVEVGTVGGDIKSTRGMFEVLGTGSSFTQATGDQIVINSSNGSTSVASLYFVPETTSYGSGSGFTIKGSEEVGIYATVPLNDILLVANEGCTAKILTTDLELNDLTIGASNLFDVNNKDLFVNGDLINNASSGFDAGNGAVFFGGSGDQILGGSEPILFNDIVQDNGSQLTIDNSGVTIGGNLEVNASCVFATGDESVDVYGDIKNEGITSCSSLSNGVVMNGSDVQQITESGVFAVLTVDNTEGVVIPTQSGSVTITDRLRMERGVLDIGKNLLVLTENAVFVAVSAFSTTNMVQTNLSFTDNGIKKYFPAISSSTDFVYPLGSSDGSLTKYTPVLFTITNNGNSTGSIRVKAANESHISIIDNTETAYDDAHNVLQYNWTLDADGIEDFSATLVMQGVASDISVTDGNSADDYITACILADGINWNKYSTDDFSYDTNITQLTFTFGLTDDIGIDGDYTAGIANAIPDQVASYISVADGDYSTTTTWAVYDPDTETIGTAGVSVPAGGPRGSVIYVVDSVRFVDNFEAAYRSYIESTGILDIGTSFGHRLGDVYGTGKIRVESGSLPAGTYDDFFSASGGTLEYSGSTNYDVLSEIPSVNHLIFSGTGERRLPNIDIQLYGHLTIDGPDVENTNDVDLSIQGDLNFNSGTYDAGLNTSTILFNGSQLQYIQGTSEFTSSNSSAFFNMEIDNSAGVELSSNLDVLDQLFLTKGSIYTFDDRILTIRNTETNAVVGGSDSSFIVGPIRKNVLNSSSFEYPTGYSNIYGPVKIAVDGSSGGYWEAEYIGMNPASYTDRPMNPITVTSPVEYVSRVEFWRVEAPDASDLATVTLYWNENSGVNPNDTAFTMVNWSASPSWEAVNIGSPVGTSSNGYVSSSSKELFNTWASEGNYYSFGSNFIQPYSWIGGVSTDWDTPANWSDNVVPSASSDVTINAGVTYNPVIENVANVNNLDIVTGGLTIDSGSKVNIFGDLTTNDELVINHTQTTSSSLVVSGTITGTATVNMLNNYTYKVYRLLGVIADGVTMTDFDNSYPTGYYVYQYASGWSMLTSGYSEFDTYPMRGYYVGSKGDGENLSYSGTLHNDASYSYTATSRGWNLVCNPYPCYIDISSAAFTLDANCEQAVYIRRSDDNVVQTYWVDGDIAVNNASNLLAPGQGFWVWAEASGATITIGSASRTNTGGTVGFKSATTSPDVLRLKMSNGIIDDETVMVFRSDGSDSYSNSDIDKLTNSGSNINFYSLKDNKDLVINLMPDAYDGETIPVGYSLKSGTLNEYTLKVSGISGFSDELIYLDDLQKGVSVELTDTTEYTFTPSSTNSDDRFQIRIMSVLSSEQSEITTGIEESANGDVSVYTSGQNAVILVSKDLVKSNGGKVVLYDLSGEVISQTELNGAKTIIPLPQTNTMYIVNVVAGLYSYQQKVIVTK